MIIRGLAQIIPDSQSIGDALGVIKQQPGIRRGIRDFSGRGGLGRNEILEFRTES